MTEYLENVSIRFIKSSQKGIITYTDELNILEYLVQKFKLKTISQYAKENNISYQGTLKKLKSKKLMTIKLSNKLYIIN